MWLLVSFHLKFLNQIRAKVGVKAPQENFTDVVGWSDSDDVTSFQVENPASVQGAMVTFPWDRGLNPNHHPAHFYKDLSSRVIVDLQVDIVPSSGRHSQFSIMVLHAACKMAVRGTERPVFDLYTVKRELMLILGVFH